MGDTNKSRRDWNSAEEMTQIMDKVMCGLQKI